MKRVLSILAICVVLFSMMGVAALAQTYDVTPPMVWGLGVTPTTDAMKGCPGNVAVMVQVKAADTGGVEDVMAEVKAPGAVWTAAADFTMELEEDGFWRVWIPKTFFATAGTWQIRAEASDWANNETHSGAKTLTVTSCDRTPPSVSDPTESADPIVASWCTGVKTETIQAIVKDASGVKKVNLWYMVPGGSLWQVVPMSRYLSDSYRATIGPFADGTLAYYVKAIDIFNHSTTTGIDTVTVKDCP